MGWALPWYTAVGDEFQERCGTREYFALAGLPARRRPCLPHLRDAQPRRRGARQRVDVPRPDAARPPGGVGGHAARPPAGPALPVVAATTTSTRVLAPCAPDGPLPDDRGPGRRHLAPVAGARAGVRGERRAGAVPLRPPAQPRRRGRARLARRVGDAQRAGRAHEHAAARHARLPGHVPPPLRRREGRRGRRPRVGRARRARPRRGLERARARRLRLPVPAARPAHGDARRAARDRAPPVDRGAVLVRRRALPDRRARRAAEARPVHRTRRC